jgi:hypothetical protein
MPMNKIFDNPQDLHVSKECMPLKCNADICLIFQLFARKINLFCMHAEVHQSGLSCTCSALLAPLGLESFFHSFIHALMNIHIPLLFAEVTVTGDAFQEHEDSS